MPAQRQLRLTQRDQSGILGQVGRRTRPTPPPRLSPMLIHSNSDSSETSNEEPPEIGDLQRMLNLMRNSEGLVLLNFVGGDRWAVICSRHHVFLTDYR